MRTVMVLAVLTFAASLALVVGVFTQEPPIDTWMGLRVEPEIPTDRYSRRAFGHGYVSMEPMLVARLPLDAAGRPATPYTCAPVAVRPDGTADTDIEHVVALAEAVESGLRAAHMRQFGRDERNLTVATPHANRSKGEKDAADWQPPRNEGWFAATVVAVKQRYRLSVDAAERDALKAMLAGTTRRKAEC